MAQVYKVPSHIAWRRVEEEVVLLDLNTSVYYSLNSVAARMWELLAESRGVEEMARQVAVEFEEDPAQVSKDAAEFVQDLSRQKLVEPA